MRTPPPPEARRPVTRLSLHLCSYTAVSAVRGDRETGAKRREADDAMARWTDDADGDA